MRVLSRIDFEDFDGRKGFACYSDDGELIQLNVYVWHAWPVEHWQITPLDCGHPLWKHADESFRTAHDLDTRYAVCYTQVPARNEDVKGGLATANKALSARQPSDLLQWTIFGEVGPAPREAVAKGRGPKHPKR